MRRRVRKSKGGASSSGVRGGEFQERSAERGEQGGECKEGREQIRVQTSTTVEGNADSWLLVQFFP
jgi:hypothetical protein